MHAGMPSAGASGQAPGLAPLPSAVRRHPPPWGPRLPSRVSRKQLVRSCPAFLGWEWRRQAPAPDDKVTASRSKPAHRAPLLRCCWAVTKSCHQGPVIGDRGGRAGAEGATRVVAGRPVGLAVATLSCVPWVWPSSSPRGEGGSIPGSEGGHCGLWTLPGRNQILQESVSTLPSKARSLGGRGQGDAYTQMHTGTNKCRASG